MFRSKTVVCPASADVSVVETGCGVTLLEMLASGVRGALQLATDMSREDCAPL